MFPELEELATHRFWVILGEIPFVLQRGFRPKSLKIGGEPTLRAREKNVPVRFFFDFFYKVRSAHSFDLRYFRAPTDPSKKFGTLFIS